MFFIPCIKWNKHYYVRTSCCNTLYELDPEMGKAIARVSLPFCPPPRVRQSPALRRAQLLAEFQRKTLRPLGTNTLAQFEYPAQPVLRNAARIGRTACAVRASQRVGAGIACAAVKPPQLHINYVCVTPAYTV